MRGDLPDGLPQPVRDAARILIETARREGWTVEQVGHSDGRISISATSPTGSGFYFACREDEFIDRLRSALLKTK
ncbi:MAG TPA: hypothetical protein VHC90_09240 [Bryobacteraceae bacterium]|nr:hypothetical protein [Bryobacteraceae bacterium]